uniref:RNase H type-1 domain-containing protein n=1 Tax=Buteo japonicus TaxID=224669 RepID=A0A8C0AVE7_9AVES
MWYQGKRQIPEPLIAVWQAIDATPPNHICYLDTDSWAVAQGLVHWLPKWHADQWQIGTKDVWGRPYWEHIWDLLQDRDIRVFHVDAHTKEQSEIHLGNAQADALAKIQSVKLEEQSNAALARWAHEKASHGGRDATIAWAKAQGVQLSVKDVQTCIAQCETCQLLKRHPYLDQPVGCIRQGTTGGEVWQIDYIGPLWEHRQQRYICTQWIGMPGFHGLGIHSHCHPRNHKFRGP